MDALSVRICTWGILIGMLETDAFGLIKLQRVGSPAGAESIIPNVFAVDFVWFSQFVVQNFGKPQIQLEFGRKPCRCRL